MSVRMNAEISETIKAKKLVFGMQRKFVSAGYYTERIIQVIWTQIEYFCTQKFSMNKNSHTECKILPFSTNFSKNLYLN